MSIRPCAALTRGGIGCRKGAYATFEGKEYCTLHFNRLLRPAHEGRVANERDVYISAAPLTPTENEVESESSESDDSESEEFPGLPPCVLDYVGKEYTKLSAPSVDHIARCGELFQEEMERITNPITCLCCDLTCARPCGGFGIDLANGYPSPFDGNAVQFEDMLDGPELEAVIRSCREEALKLRKTNTSCLRSLAEATGNTRLFV